MDLTGLIQLVDPLMKNESSWLVIVPLSIIAFVLEKWQYFPSKYICPVCIAGGIILMPVFSKVSQVPDTYPYPLAVLMADGCVLGFLAWLAHASIIAKLIGWLQPVPAAAKQENAAALAAGARPAIEAPNQLKTGLPMTVEKPIWPDGTSGPPH